MYGNLLGECLQQRLWDVRLKNSPSRVLVVLHNLSSSTGYHRSPQRVLRVLDFKTMISPDLFHNCQQHHSIWVPAWSRTDFAILIKWVTNLHKVSLGWLFLIELCLLLAKIVTQMMSGTRQRLLQLYGMTEMFQMQWHMAETFQIKWQHTDNRYIPTHTALDHRTTIA